MTERGELSMVLCLEKSRRKKLALADPACYIQEVVFFLGLRIFSAV